MITPNIYFQDVLETISTDKGRDCDSKLLSPEHWESRHVRGRHAEHHACFLKPGCSYIGPEISKSTVHIFCSGQALLTFDSVSSSTPQKRRVI
jgi:hypothetical protein